MCHWRICQLGFLHHRGQTARLRSSKWIFQTTELSFTSHFSCITSPKLTSFEERGNPVHYLIPIIIAICWFSANSSSPLMILVLSTVGINLYSGNHRCKNIMFYFPNWISFPFFNPLSTWNHKMYPCHHNNDETLRRGGQSSDHSERWTPASPRSYSHIHQGGEGTAEMSIFWMSWNLI